MLLAVQLNCVTDGHWQTLHIQNLASAWSEPQTHHSLSSTWLWKVNIKSTEVEYCLMQAGTSYASASEVTVSRYYTEHTIH